MEICHYKKTKEDDADAGEFDVVVRFDAMGEVVGKGTVVDDEQDTDGGNSKSTERPTKVKTKIHKFIVT